MTLLQQDQRRHKRHILWKKQNASTQINNHRLIMGNRQVTRQRGWWYNIIYKIQSRPPIIQKNKRV